MKGIVFNLLEEVITSQYGAVAWDALLEHAGVSGVYTSLGSYPDDEMFRLVQAASDKLSLSGDEVLRWFGKNAIQLLAIRYPIFFDPHRDTRSFLLTLNNIIHPEVHKLYQGADTPVFDFDTSDAHVLAMGYRSPRKLCALAEGFVEGAAAYFGEKVQHEHRQCMHRNDPKCLFIFRFVKTSG